MQRHPIPYRSTNRFTPIVLGYLDGAPSLNEHSIFHPDREGLRSAMAARRFDPQMRTRLSSALERQYAGVNITPETRANLNALKSEGTLTVTTGHQLWLFTGPLYLPFKILNVIRLARELTTPDRAVVPIFWMAAEDHERAGIDHAWINGKKITWPSEGGGAAGKAKLTGIDAVLAELDPLLGVGTHADDLRAMLRAAYKPEHTLAQATRLFINALFGRFGLVILDGDDADLKSAFVPIMQEELLNEVVKRTVDYANQKLEGQYEAQAHARDINLFHLRDGHRSRIVREDDRYRVLDNGPSWMMDELLAELQQHPEKFSPNVLMRPLYQETILPNIAYVGGGGELSYWLQLRWLFQSMQLPMPALVLRTSATLLSAKDDARWKELGLEIGDLFADANELRARVATAQAGFSTDLSRERADLQEFFDRLSARVRVVDPTLVGTVLTGTQQAMKGLAHMEEKLVRAAKRQQETALQRIDGVLAHVFPEGMLHERRDNFMPWYCAKGPAFFDELLAQLDPLDARFTVLTDQ